MEQSLGGGVDYGFARSEWVDTEWNIFRHEFEATATDTTARIMLARFEAGHVYELKRFSLREINPEPTLLPASKKAKEPTPPVEIAKPVKVETPTPKPIDPKDDPKNIPQNKQLWNKAMSGKASFDYENNSGRFAIGEGVYMFETHWSPRGNDDVYVTNNGLSVEAVALVPGRGSPKRIKKASSLDFSSYYRTVKVGEQAVLRNQHGKYAVVQVNRIVNRERTPAARNLLEFSFYILPDGDDFSKAK